MELNTWLQRLLENILPDKDKENNKNKYFEGENLAIKGNILVCERDNTFIQISNITQVYLGRSPKKAFPIIPFAFFAILAYLGISQNFSIGTGVLQLGAAMGGNIFFVAIINIFIFIGYLSAIVAAIILIFYLLQIRKYSLNLKLASSNVYSFSAKDKSFLQGAYGTLLEIIHDGNKLYEGSINFNAEAININDSFKSSIGTY
jgi:hypothetical protein